MEEIVRAAVSDPTQVEVLSLEEGFDREMETGEPPAVSPLPPGSR
jgi:hypothetical protein